MTKGIMKTKELISEHIIFKMREKFSLLRHIFHESQTLVIFQFTVLF